MKTGETTKAAEAAYVVMNGGRLLEVVFISETTAVFRYEAPNELRVADYYGSPFVDFVRARNIVFDALNNSKKARIEERLRPLKREQKNNMNKELDNNDR